MGSSGGPTLNSHLGHGLGWVTLPDGFLVWALALVDDLVALSDRREHLAHNLALLGGVHGARTLHLASWLRSKMERVAGLGQYEEMHWHAAVWSLG